MKKTISYGKIRIPLINSKDKLVPKQAIEVNLNETDQLAIAIAVRDNLPALLIGETGTGKTSIIRHLAHLRKQPYVRVNMTGFTTPDDLIGSKSIKDDQTYFEYGVISDAMLRGAILVLDEINATTPDCLFILHGLLDEDRRVTLPNGDIITPHPDFRVFATCNPDYEGTRSMNKAFLDRFPIILHINHLPVDEEIKLIVERTKVDEQTAKELVSMATMARTEYMNSKLTMFVSTRTLLHTARLVAHGVDFKTAYKLTVMRKTNNLDEQKVVLDFYLAIRRENDKGDEDNLLELIKLKELRKLKQDASSVPSLKQEIVVLKDYQGRATNAFSEVKTHVGGDPVIRVEALAAIFNKHGIRI